MRLFCVVAVIVAFLGASAQAGIDRGNFDTTANPAVDFYQYVNGRWLLTHPVPASNTSWGAYDDVSERNLERLHAILEDAARTDSPSPIQRMVGDFYASGMDVNAIDREGIAPLKPELDRLARLRSMREVEAAIARLHGLGVDACFDFGSEQDPADSSRQIAGASQGGLGLPDRDYYLKTDELSSALRRSYVGHMARMLELAGDPGPMAAREAAAVMRLETELAKVSRTNVALRDPVANYHWMGIAAAQKLAPHFGWPAYFDGIGLATPSGIDIGQPEFFQAFDTLLQEVPVEDWRAYLRWHLVHAFAAQLSTPFAKEDFDFYGRSLTGQTEMRPRWKRVLSTADVEIGEALGQLYVAECFPPAARARVLAMVRNIRAALRADLQNLPWMDDPTRAAALDKLEAMGLKIGYPDRWRDYGKLHLDRGPYVLNVLRARQFNVRHDLDKIGKPVDRTEWQMTPQTVNAYYDPSMNEIVFPAGILQPPFFDPKADDAVNYGAIGAVIGHETTHGFDDEGRQFDAHGNLRDWWTPESSARFNERAAAIIKQFNGCVAIDDLHVNGELTQGENIADLGGVKLAFRALQFALAGKPPALVGGFTPEQRFFISFATIWRENDRPETLRLLVNTDPHVPSRFRVNGALSNLPEFAEAFGVPEGAPMRRPASERVEIW